MENVKMLNFLKETKIWFNFSLILFLISFVFLNYHNEYNNQFRVQIALAGLLFLFFNIGLKRKFSINIILLLIAIFHIIVTLFIHLYDIVDTPPDSNFYRNYGILYNMQDWNTLSNLIDKADWGYVTFVGFFFDVFGSEIGEIFIAFIKLVLHILTCRLIYNLVYEFHDVDYAKTITLLWGLNLGATYWITAFLKENLFCFIVTCAVYCLYKYRNTDWSIKKKLYLFNFSILVLYTGLFREMFPIFFTITFILFSFFSNIVNKYFGVICIAAILASYMAIEYIIYFIPNAAGGFIQREELYGNNIIMSILNVINPLISPYPALDLNKNQIANIQISAFASYNITFAYFSIMGIYYVVKNNLSKCYPIIMILLLNSVMLISFGFSMNYRFIYVTTPIFYLFIPYGIKYYYKISLLIPYILFIISLTLFYNIR